MPIFSDLESETTSPHAPLLRARNLSTAFLCDECGEHHRTKLLFDLIFFRGLGPLLFLTAYSADNSLARSVATVRITANCIFLRAAKNVLSSFRALRENCAFLQGFARGCREKRLDSFCECELQADSQRFHRAQTLSNLRVACYSMAALANAALKTRT